jgi:hypothetical protein
MKYTINGKEYTEWRINTAIAEKIYGYPSDKDIKRLVIERRIDFCNNWKDAGVVIEKCWDELNDIWLEKDGKTYISLWKYLVQKHNCTKLVAACICFIEINEVQNDSTIQSKAIT